MNAIESQRPPRMWNSRFLTMLLIEVLIQTGIFILQPNLSNYLILMGASLSVAGIIVGLNYCTALLMRLVSGYICDLLDKKVLLICSCVLFVVASSGIILANSPSTVAAFRVVQGLAYVLKSSVVVAMASMVVPKDSVGAGIGIIGLGFTVACAVGPALGDYLGGLYGYKISFLVSVCLFAGALLLAVRVKAPLESRGSWRNLEGNKIESALRQLQSLRISDVFYLPSLTLAATVFFAFVSQSMMLALALTFANANGVTGASVYYMAYACVAMVSKPLSGRMLDKHGVLFVLAPMTAIVCGSMLLLACSFTAITLAVAGALMGLGQGSVWSCLQAEAVRSAPAGMSGRSVNTFYVGSDSTQCFCPFIFSTVFASFGVRVCFILAALCGALSLAIFVISKRNA